MNRNMKVIGIPLAVVLALTVFALIGSVNAEAEWVDGTFVDSWGGQPIEGMTVAVLNETDVVMGFDITDVDGYANITSLPAENLTYRLDGEKVFVNQVGAFSLISGNQSLGTVSVNYTSDYPSLYTAKVKFTDDVGAPLEGVHWRIQDGRGSPTGVIEGYSDVDGYAYVPYDAFSVDAHSNRHMVYSKNYYYPNATDDLANPYNSDLSAHYSLDADGQWNNEGGVNIEGMTLTPGATHVGEIYRTDASSHTEEAYEAYGLLLNTTLIQNETLYAVTASILTGHLPADTEFTAYCRIYDDGLTRFSIVDETNITINTSYWRYSGAGYTFTFDSPITFDYTKTYFIEIRAVGMKVERWLGASTPTHYSLYVDTTGTGSFSSKAGTVSAVLHGPQTNLSAITEYPVQTVQLFENDFPDISIDYDYAANPINVNGTNWTQPLAGIIDWNVTYTFESDALDAWAYMDIYPPVGCGESPSYYDLFVEPDAVNTTFYLEGSTWIGACEGIYRLEAHVANEYYDTYSSEGPIVSLFDVVYLNQTNTAPSIFIDTIYSDLGTLTQQTAKNYTIHSTDELEFIFLGLDDETYVDYLFLRTYFDNQEYWYLNGSYSSSSAIVFQDNLDMYTDNNSAPEYQLVTFELGVKDTNGAWTNTTYEFWVWNDRPILGIGIENIDDQYNQPFWDGNVLNVPLEDEILFNFSTSENSDWALDVPTYSYGSLQYEGPIWALPPGTSYYNYPSGMGIRGFDTNWYLENPGGFTTEFSYFDTVWYTGLEYLNLSIGVSDDYWDVDLTGADVPLTSFSPDFLNYFRASYKPDIEWEAMEYSELNTGDELTVNASMSIDWDTWVSDDEPGDLDYLWIFSINDGEHVDTYFTPMVDYTAPDSGELNITLVITDEDGWTARDSRSFTIGSAPPTLTMNDPIETEWDGYGGVLVVGPENFYTVDGITLNAEWSDVDGGTDTVWWDFGDGNTSLVLNRTYAYGNDGVYLVKLVSDGTAGETYISFWVEAINAPPIADAGGPFNDVVGALLIFNASESYDPDGEIVGYYWDFGDGDNSNLTVVQHIYTTIGSYIIQMTVTDDDGNHDTHRYRVNITTAPVLTTTTPDVEASGSAGSNIVASMSIEVDATTAEMEMYIAPTGEIYGIVWTYKVYDPNGQLVAVVVNTPDQTGTFSIDDVTIPTLVAGDYTIILESDNFEAGSYTGDVVFTPYTQSGVPGEALSVSLTFTVAESGGWFDGILGNEYLAVAIVLILLVVCVLAITHYRKKQRMDSLRKAQMEPQVLESNQRGRF